MIVRRRLSLSLSLALCAVSLGAVSLTAASSSTSALPAPRFHRAAGWLVVKPTRAEQPGLWQSMIVAVTVHDAGAAHPFAVFTSLTRLSRRGILIWATTIGRNRPTFTPMQWPPRLSSFRVDHAWENQPAPNVPQRLKWGAIEGWDLDVRVYFATQHPGKELLQAAQAQLNRLVLPSR
jgi:hypothetical protein